MVAAPLSPEELFRRADLAGYGQIVAKKNGTVRLRFAKVLKGTVPGRGWLAALGLRPSVEVRLRAQVVNPVPGDWWDADGYPVGATVLVHLWWNKHDSCYETLWWNAVEVVKPAR